MSTLHIVNKSPFERDALASCLQRVRPGAALLLIEDGVYGALDGSEHAASLARALGDIKVYALAPDLDARGLRQRVIAGVNTVDYAGFVELVGQYRVTQSWL